MQMFVRAWQDERRKPGKPTATSRQCEYATGPDSFRSGLPRTSSFRRIFMTIASADVLSGHLKPLRPRDNHVMKYESRGSRANTGDHASYHCGCSGCSVRFNSTDGYYMLMGMPGHTYAVEEPGVNTEKCPIHDRWLYRRHSIDVEPGVRWCCGVEGCDYGYDAKTKRDWIRT
jgi:hypothetical protein